jgi:carboxymethylenebutenolidase
MCDDEIHQGLTYDPGLSRRGFGLAAAAAGGLAASGAHAATEVVEKDVDVKTPDGVADCALFYPSGKGPWPAVLIWTDILGLRPAFRDMGRRLAAQGYVVLVPNPFYRAQRAPVVGPDFDFNDAAARAKVFGFASALTAEAVPKDAIAYIGYLDSLPQTDKARGVGTQGYCMGGPLVYRTAATVPGRVKAAATFHGGGLVGAQPTSPNKLIPLFKAEVYSAVADNDDKKSPDDKNVLKAAFADAKVPAKVEVYDGCNHGWCVKGSQVYNEAGAERAWAELTALYQRRL